MEANSAQQEAKIAVKFHSEWTSGLQRTQADCYAPISRAAFQRLVMCSGFDAANNYHKLLELQRWSLAIYTF